MHCPMPRQGNDPQKCVVEDAAVADRLDNRLQVPLRCGRWLRRTSLGCGKLRGYASLVCTFGMHAVGVKQLL